MSAAKYGLTIPKKAEAPSRSTTRSAAVSSVFGGADSDDDDEVDLSSRAGVNKMLQLQADKSQRNKKLQREMEAALEQDATVYQYDEVYDDMAVARQQNDPRFERLNAGGGAERKAKYIESLMKAAAERKKVEDVRLAHKIQREREAEEEEYGDKEEFITSAYRKKLEEVRKQEELDRLQEALEAKQDVTKKSDLSGFYRNLLTKNVAFGADNAPAAVPQPAPAASAAGDASTARAATSPSPPPHARDDHDKGRYADIPTDAPSADAAPAGGLDTRRYDERRRREQDAAAQRAAEDRRRREEDARHGRRDDRRNYDRRDSDRRDSDRRDHDRRSDIGDRRSYGDDRSRSRSRSPLRREELSRPAAPAAAAAAAATAALSEEELAAKFGRKTTDDAISAARERYLARKKERAHVPKPVME